MSPVRREPDFNIITDTEGSALKEREKCMADLYYFSKWCMENNDLYEPLHRPMAEWFQNWPKRPVSQRAYMYRLSMWPRGNFKTTIGTINHSLWLWLHDPMIKIANIHYKQDGSQANLYEIKTALMENEKLRAIAPDICWTDENECKRSNVVWLSDRIAIRRPRKHKVPSYVASSVGATLVSMHFDWIKLDDIIVEETVQSEDGIAKSNKYIELVKGLIKDGSNARVDITGTHWAPNDSYSLFRDPKGKYYDPDPEKSRVAVKAVGCFGNDPETGKPYQGDEPGAEPIFPTRLPREVLEDYKKDGLYVFSCQYLNDPIADDLVTFDASKINWYTESDMQEWIRERKKFLTWTSVDPNRKQEKKHDPGVILTVSRDVDGNFIERRTDYRRFDPTEAVDVIIEHYLEFNPECILIEDTAGQVYLIDMLEKELLSRGLYASVVPVTRGPQDRKPTRILRCEGPITRGKVWLRSELGEDHPFFKEIKTYGVSGSVNDHALDAFSDIVARSVPPTTPKEKSTPVGQFVLKRVAGMMQKNRRGMGDLSRRLW